MTFVSLPSFSDVFSDTTGAGAWSYPAMQEFIGAIFVAIGVMSAAIILYWLGTHLSYAVAWMNQHLFGQQKNEISNYKPTGSIVGRFREVIFFKK